MTPNTETEKENQLEYIGVTALAQAIGCDTRAIQLGLANGRFCSDARAGNRPLFEKSRVEEIRAILATPFNVYA